MASSRQMQFWLTMRGIQEGYSGAKILGLLREFNLGIRTQEFYRLFSEAREVVREAGQEPTRPLDQVPTLAETRPIAAMPTAEPGVLQTVRLVYREAVTGNLRVVFHSTKSAEGITRQQAISNAIDAYASHNEEYQTTLIAAAHTSAIRIVPTELAA